MSAAIEAAASGLEGTATLPWNPRQLLPRNDTADSRLTFARSQDMAARNKVSLATAKIVPVFLSLIIGYASYVITGPLAIEYLINPPDGVPQRIASGIAIQIAYYMLLLPVGTSWLRLLYVVLRNPGYVSLGPSRKDEAEPAPGT